MVTDESDFGLTGWFKPTTEDNTLNSDGAKEGVQVITDFTKSDFDPSKLQERIENLSGGAAVIKV